MNDTNKSRPGDTPSGPESLAMKVGAVNQAPADPNELRITLDIEGGSPADRYELHVAATGSGDVESGMKDRLRQLDLAPRVGQAQTEEVAEVLKRLDVAQMIALRSETPPIPPDSTVGVITISDGSQEVSIPFMADPGQAEAAGFELPADLAQAIEAIYEIAARQLDVETVKP
jgi:hypothetical protein